MGLFSRRRYVAGTVPEEVEALDGPVLGAPPASAYQPAPIPANEHPADPGAGHDHLDDDFGPDGDDFDDDFYDDEDSEDRPGDPVGFLPAPPTRLPRRKRRGVGVAAVVFAIALLVARGVVDDLSGDGSGPPSGWDDVPDVYADVAAEPERQLTAQDVEFLLLTNRPLDPTVCAGLERCLAGAAAEWEVTGTQLVGRSWYLVFDDEAEADAAAASPSLAGVFNGIGSGWAVRAGSPGRFLAVAGVGPAGGGANDVSADPTAVEAADALRIFSTSPAAAEIWSR